MATVTVDQLNRIVFAYHYDPFAVLGAHPVTVNEHAAMAIRAFRPGVAHIRVVWQNGETTDMEQLSQDGFFEAVVPQDQFQGYMLELIWHDGHSLTIDDPYRFGTVLGDLDLQLIGEGEHHHLYNILGAHVLEHEGVQGTAFAVWAPAAQAISVVGDFNQWDPRIHLMRTRGGGGIWELFIPGVTEGFTYKYHILTQSGVRLDKADPIGFASELRPNTASRVWNIDKFEWHDEEWIAKRAATDWLKQPMNIYEVYLPSWIRDQNNPDAYPNYREIAPKLADYVTSMGYTHVEILPITEYPFDGSWGYQALGFFAPTSRMGTPDDFQFFVDHLHQRGIGVFMDWVPAHFIRDAHGLGRFDGTSLYEHPDPRIGEHKEWGTYIFNYGRNEVRNFLIGSALFWLGKYHIDGFRVDAVASMLYLDYSRNPGEWVPNIHGGRENLEAIYFLRRMNELTHQYYPGTLTMAEESTSFPFVTRPTYLGGLGFDFKWNMGWMNDTLAYIQADPIYRKFEHTKLTFGLMYAFSENFILPISHDEVVHLKKSLAGKMPGDYWKQMANLRLYFGFMFTHPGKKLLFMGQDIGQWREFSELREVDWFLLENEQNKGANQWLRDLLHLIKNQPALYEQDHSWEGFQWVDVHDYENSIISYVRYAEDKEDYLICIHNFTPNPRYHYRIGAPEAVEYLEVLNSDGGAYWGSGVGNGGQITAFEEPWGLFAATLELTIPPLATLILKPNRQPKPDPDPAPPVEKKQRRSRKKASEQGAVNSEQATEGTATAEVTSDVAVEWSPGQEGAGNGATDDATPVTLPTETASSETIAPSTQEEVEKPVETWSPSQPSAEDVPQAEAPAPAKPKRQRKKKSDTPPENG